MFMNPVSDDEFAAKIGDFECQRCNQCCLKPGYVYLKKGEEERIATYLGLDPYQFTEEYCDLVDRQRLVLKKREGEVCVFLEDSGCRIHEVKPQQCRDFPMKWHTENSLQYCEGLKKLFGRDSVD